MGASQEVDDALGTLRNATLTLRDAAQLKADPLVVSAEVFTGDGQITKPLAIAALNVFAADATLTLPDLNAVEPGSLWIVKKTTQSITLAPFEDDDGLQNIDLAATPVIISAAYACVGLIAATPGLDPAIGVSSWLVLFHSGGLSPHIAITLPTDDSGVTEGDTVAFAATASDADGTDGTASIVWTSDLDGALHTGGSFSTTGLSVGHHTLTAMYTNGAGVGVSASVTLDVGDDVAPTITITAPSDPATAVGGNSVAFAATATDTEDGDLGTAIAWTSNLDGALHTGASFSSSSLSVGVHTITASVTDSHSNTRTDTVTVTITAP